MDFWHIRAVNSEFDIVDEGASYASPEDALAVGVRSAVAMVAEDVNRGIPTCAIEISVQGEDEKPVLRAVVALSVARLHIG